MKLSPLISLVLFCGFAMGAVQPPELAVTRNAIGQPRHLNDRIRHDLSALIQKHDLKKIHVRSEFGDEESRTFASEIRSYLKGFPIEIETGEMKSRFQTPGIGVAVKGQVAYFTVGKIY
jgi:hypothetical protein